MQLILIQILLLLNFQFFYAIMYSFMQFGVLYKLAFEFCSSKIRVFKEINGVDW